MTKGEKRQRMFAIVREYMDGGKSRNDICHQYHITSSCLGYWQLQYKRSQEKPEAGFVEVKIATSNKSKTPVTIIYPNKVKIKLKQLLDVRQLEMLINLV